MLRETAIRNAKPQDKPYKLADGHGRVKQKRPASKFGDIGAGHKG